MDGVIRTRVGYSGGQKLNPTYRSIGDHSETIQIDYDPARISYQDLLLVFWQSHDPTYKTWRRQYMSAIFYHDDEQRKLALETRALEEDQRNRKIHTEITALGRFYLAEDYHQKYELRRLGGVMREFKAMYPRDIDFINSTAAARANGFVGGHGTPEQFKATVGYLGLSTAAQEKLHSVTKRRRN